MTQCYPLFDELVRRINERNGTGIDIKIVCNTINNMSQYMPKSEYNKHYDEIEALIIHYHSLQTKNEMTNIYDVKLMAGGKGLLYTIEKIDPHLQQIIAEYLIYYSQ
jgi:hypothetical protein